MSRPERSVLFVCLGNICRSPTGEGLMRAYAEEQGAAVRLHVDSAGTIAYHRGNPPDPRMTEAAAQRGYRLEGQSRPVESVDFQRFDLIVAMDRSNYSDLMEVPGADPEKVRLLSSFLTAGPEDVPDPYYGGPEGFETVIDLIEEACPPIFDHLFADLT